MLTPENDSCGAVAPARSQRTSGAVRRPNRSACPRPSRRRPRSGPGRLPSSRRVARHVALAPDARGDGRGPEQRRGRPRGREPRPDDGGSG
jgi:hypothetical protein